MELQQRFGQRLESLLNEKGISQGEFADLLHCSRQSINFYVLGKRFPDITLAAEMADRLGVSCDYLVGRSDIRQEDDANLTAVQLGMDDETIKLFGGLNLLAKGMVDFSASGHAANAPDFEKEMAALNAAQAQDTLDLLNRMISHERFGILLQYIRRYQELSRGEDVLTLLQHFMVELESPTTGNTFGSSAENAELLMDFCLHIAASYLVEIIKDITKD